MSNLLELTDTLKALRAKTTTSIPSLAKLEILKDIRSVERAIINLAHHKHQIEIQRGAVQKLSKIYLTLTG